MSSGTCHARGLGSPKAAWQPAGNSAPVQGWPRQVHLRVHRAWPGLALRISLVGITGRRPRRGSAEIGVAGRSLVDCLPTGRDRAFPGACWELCLTLGVVCKAPIRVSLAEPSRASPKGMEGGRSSSVWDRAVVREAQIPCRLVSGVAGSRIVCQQASGR